MSFQSRTQFTRSETNSELACQLSVSLNTPDDVFYQTSNLATDWSGTCDLFATFVQQYDFYRVVKCKIEYFPYQNVAERNKKPVQNNDPVHAFVDRNANTPPAIIATAGAGFNLWGDYRPPDRKHYPWNRHWKYMVKGKRALSLNPVMPVGEFSQWVNVNSTDLERRAGIFTMFWPNAGEQDVVTPEVFAYGIVEATYYVKMIRKAAVNSLV